MKARCEPAGEARLSEGVQLFAADWWDEPIYLFVNGTPLSRKTLVLAAANKDGGAHVDKLPQPYAKLQKGTAVSGIGASGDGGTEFYVAFSMLGDLQADGEPIENFQYADLRQMATELLNSAELLSLAGQ
jgi:hypothetical protein